MISIVCCSINYGMIKCYKSKVCQFRMPSFVCLNFKLIINKFEVLMQNLESLNWKLKKVEYMQSKDTLLSTKSFHHQLFTMFATFGLDFSIKWNISFHFLFAAIIKRSICFVLEKYAWYRIPNTVWVWQFCLRWYNNNNIEWMNDHHPIVLSETG